MESGSSERSTTRLERGSQEVEPAAPLISREREVQGGRTRGRDGLVHCAARQVEHVAGLEQRVEDGRAEVGLAEVGRRRTRQHVAARRRVHPPALGALDLEHIHIDVVVVRREALRLTTQRSAMLAHSPCSPRVWTTELPAETAADLGENQGRAKCEHRF